MPRDLISLAALPRGKRLPLLFVLSSLMMAAALVGCSTTGPIATTPTPPPSKTAAQRLDARLLSADPMGHKGQNVVISGEALNVQQQSDYTWVQVMAEVGPNLPPETIVAFVRPKMTSLLKSECYRVYGVVTGTTPMQLIYTGAQEDVPSLAAYAVDTGRNGPYGIGCAQ